MALVELQDNKLLLHHILVFTTRRFTGARAIAMPQYVQRYRRPSHS